MQRRLVHLFAIPLLGLLCSQGALAEPDYHALIIRQVETADYVVVKKLEVNDKKSLHQIRQALPLAAKQYNKLPKLSFSIVHSFRIRDGLLQVRKHDRSGALAIPGNFKPWPRGKRALPPSDITSLSRLTGKRVDTGRSLSEPLKNGLVVYLYGERPSEVSVAFALAETQDKEEKWVQFLERYPHSSHSETARQHLGAIYLERARQALMRFQEALDQKKSGFDQLASSRRWINELHTVNIELPGAANVVNAVARLESDIDRRLQEARSLAEGADFDSAEEMLAPLAHFRSEFPRLATELEVIRGLRARHYVEQARGLLTNKQFDSAEDALDTAEQVLPLAEISIMREEIKQERVNYARNQEIQQALTAARQAEARGDYAGAFDILWPLALRYPEERALQNAFASVRGIFSQSLLAEVPKLEELHTPLRGPADEKVLLKAYSQLNRLRQFEPTPSIAVMRDRLSFHLADYYLQRSQDVAERGGDHLAALSLAYLQQARHFSPDRSVPAEYSLQRNRLEDQLRTDLTLTVRDSTPEANAANIVIELSIWLGNAIQRAGFPHVHIIDRHRIPGPRVTLESIVELTYAGVRESTQTEMLMSEYSAGPRLVPNPEWRKAKEEYDRAVDHYEEVVARIDRNRRQKKYSEKQQQADQQALANADRARRKAEKSLDEVPDYIEQEDVRPYEFVRRTITRTGEIRLGYRWVNAQTGEREVQELLSAKEPVQGVEISGVYPSDKNGHTNQSADLLNSVELRGRLVRKVQDELARRAIDYLKSFIERELDHASQEADRGNHEFAAEHYLRFLFNSLPDDPRRPTAVDYLERQFQLVTLDDWLSVQRDH